LSDTQPRDFVHGKLGPMKPLALWCTGSNSAELRPSDIGEGLLVKTLFSGISRGTERLVFEGRVPEGEQDRMRCAGQEGSFSFPVKYGYCAVGQVLEGEHVGRKVFSLHPHQNSFRAPADMLHLLPENLPAERAILAANMETALNILWDSGAAAGDRIAIIGAGVIGSLIGYLAARLPGAEVTLVDLNPNRASLAGLLGCDFAFPADAPTNCDVVIHTSASGEGLNLAMAIAGQEGRIVEGSWFGTQEIALNLGGSFHSKRLQLIASQVGNLPAARLPRWDTRRRMQLALRLLADPVLDTLISGETAFEDMPANYGAILNHSDTLCHRIRY
jgi:threonine dehydrogenase-like Zn-dependent dehydrogenase